MKEKKRKRTEDTALETSPKRVPLESSAKTIKVSFVANNDEWAPILATTPGLSLPSTTHLKPYRKLRPNIDSSSEILLRSDAHPRLDYIAREEESNSSETLLSHYIGIYDRDTGALQLVPARKATIRGTPRLDTIDGTSEEENGPSSQVILSGRSTLGLAFGTKKAQKAIRAHTENAITSLVGNSTGSYSAKTVFDPAAAAILDVIDASAPSVYAQEQLQQTIEEARAGPKPNLQAETPAEVYPLEEMVGLDVFRTLTVRDWQEKVTAGDVIATKCRFVTGRVREVVRSGNVREMKALKYLFSLVQWYHCLTASKRQRGVKELPLGTVVAEAMDGASEQLRDSIRLRFAEGKHLNKWHISNLHLHICAIALIIDKFATDFYDLAQDLRLDTKNMQKLFTHLGCTISPPTSVELARWHLTKKDATGHKVARLRLPLKIPQPKPHLERRRAKRQ